MPRMTGEGLIRTLQSARPDLPVIVVTGAPPPGGLEALRDGSGNGHLHCFTSLLSTETSLLPCSALFWLSRTNACPPAGNCANGNGHSAGDTQAVSAKQSAPFYAATP
jgi:hypothetical protein